MGEFLPAEAGSVPESLRDFADLLEVYTPQRPKRHVYFIVDGGEVAYVGKSVNVRERIKAHEKRARVARFERVLVLPVPRTLSLSVAEDSFIRALRPRLNLTKGSGGRPLERIMRAIRAVRRTKRPQQ